MSETGPTQREAPDPLDRLLEVVLFAPVGFVMSARESLPDWVARGRQKVSTQLPLARAVGEMAVRYGSKQARASLDRLRRQADDLLDDMAASAAGRPQPPDADPDPPPPATARPVVVDEGDSGEEDDDVFIGVAGDIPPDAPLPGPSPDAGELPIPGYDTLSASQVVQRLPGLSLEELEAVRSYELAGRARKTVLLRVAQLRTAS